MSTLLEYLGKQSKLFLVAVGLVLAVFLGGVDYLTGPELSFSIFYLLPVSLLAWLGGLWPGAVVSVASAMTSVLADLAAGRVYSHPLILPWNALVRLGFFLVISLTLTILRTTKYKQDELMQFVVHDLRSPLGAIILGLGVLQRSAHEMTEIQQRSLRNSVASSQWLLTLINSLLDLSRLESGQMPLQVSETHVKELIKLSLERVTLWAERNQVALVPQLDTETETVQADQEVTLRILINLLSNAIRFSPPESVITLRVVPAEANMLAFSVSDQGPGIPKKWVGQVFDKFVQAEARRAGAAVGSGLGLTFCQLAVEVQGGRISLQSEEGQGTTVTFTLPVTTEQPAQAPVATLEDRLA